MDDFVRGQGPAFLAHVLRRVSDELVSGENEWSVEAGLTAPSRTISTLLLLDQNSPRTVTEIASHLRQSHQLVITWVRQLSSLGLVTATRDAVDARKTLIALTPEGRLEVERLRGALDVSAEVTRRLSSEVGLDVFEAVWALYDACRRRSVADRHREIEFERRSAAR